MGGQINEKTYIQVGNIPQGMFLKSADTDNPVLLFLHGGPGSPEIAFTQDHPTGLEDIFTVCWWEQRGSGITYRSGLPSETMTIEQMIADTVTVAKYLCERFDKEKIYVMGHSWGTLLGVLSVKNAPELFHAYIGMGQVVRQAESERLAYRYMLEQFRKAGNMRMVRKLEKHPIDAGADISIEYLTVRSQGMMKQGIGIMREWRSMAEAVKALLHYKGYTWREKFNFVRGSAFSLRCLWGIVLLSDFPEQAPCLEIPVYVLHGLYDYQVSYALAKEYLRTLTAPVKGFYTFENSAHSPCFEEPQKMCRILQEDVLHNTTKLADKQDSGNE